jgi:putative chitinase
MTDFAGALMRLWPNGDERIPGLRAGMIATAPEAFAKHQITTPLLLAHVMAQISHECGAGHDVVENLSYTAQRMTEVWPSRFPNIASAMPYQKNPRALANKVYNGRMGNRPGSSDGWTYRGRGGTQTTGRDGYAKLAQVTGLDLINNPDLVNDPKYFMECAVADFIACGCMPYARNDDLRGVAHSLNGGYVGLDQRAQWLSTWKAAEVLVPRAAVIASAAPARPPPDKRDHPAPKAPSALPPQRSALAAFLSAVLSFFKGRKS